jgi:hypothetical protein
MCGIDNLYGIYFIGGTAICMGVRNLICGTTLYLGYENIYGGTAIYIRICHFMWGVYNLYGIYFIGGRAIYGGRCVRLTTSTPSRAECHEIWEPKTS